MMSKRFLDTLKLVIPLIGLLVVLLSRFTAFGEYVSMEDGVIFMLCGLACLSGIENYKSKPGIGFFLISTSLILIAMRLILIFGLK